MDGFHQSLDTGRPSWSSPRCQHSPASTAPTSAVHVPQTPVVSEHDDRSENQWELVKSSV